MLLNLGGIKMLAGDISWRAYATLMNWKSIVLYVIAEYKTIQASFTDKYGFISTKFLYLCSFF